MSTLPEHPYSPSLFDADYYGNKARGGFGPEIQWEDPRQQEQLDIKFSVCESADPYDSILFVGCAMGAEPLYFSQHGKTARGVDVSQWAIDHALSEAKALVQLYDGQHMPFFSDKQFEVVASFDVLNLVPLPMREVLAKEMQRVSSKAIIIRGIAKETGLDWDGNDGVSFKYKPLTHWIALFDESFKIDLSLCNENQEYTLTFLRK